jgi:(p)ppGpp synthase/HD superfamily hydrolase
MPKEKHLTYRCNPFLSRRFYLALNLAADLHHSQCRKGTNIPYIAHLMSVCAIVLQNGGDEDLAIAAFLHDAVEDQAEGRLWKPHAAGSAIGWQKSMSSVPTRTRSQNRLGERKEAYAAHLRTASADARLISAADKLSNLRNILADYRQLGEDLWGRFNAQQEDQLWFCRAMISTLREADSNPIVDDMDNVFHQLEELIADKLRDK